jgi:hypothetical protein
MGLDINGTQFILYAKTLGVDFTRTAMIGRQNLYLTPSDLENNLANFGFSFDEMVINQIFAEESPYAEEFFRSLGAKEVHSFDNSDYEGASHVHDMNEDIPDRFNQQYSVVCDGGSLEHIFNFPMALKNCMKMVQVGGHYLGITPANNFMGHGFYQFSPELFYSVFTPGNGFALVRLIAYEDNPKAEWYSVKNPASVNERVTLTNSRRVYLLVIAKRIEKVVPLQSMPQQSDYIASWNSQNEDVDTTKQDKETGKGNTLLTAMIRHTPQSIKRIVKLLIRYDRWHAGFNPRFFQPIRRTDGMQSPNKTLQRSE